MIFIEATGFGRVQAKVLRQKQNDAEQLLWNTFRARKFHGYKFRRQVAIGHYIVDFLCVEKKVIVEIDGNAHYKKGAWNYDQKRDDYLRSEGFLVVRCNHREVIDYTNKVLNRILGYLE